MTARSVYVHIPFCRHRCGYCNFSLLAGRDHLIDRFLGCLEREVNRFVEQSGPQMETLNTLFLGGGTPSHLAEHQIARLKQILQLAFLWDQQTEVSAECNPSDISPEKLSALAALGVNRISLGAQSMNATKLATLERDHSASIIATAIEVARSYVRSVSLDLIFAGPDESFSDWQRDLNDAIQLGSDHFSTYELTYEKGTQFWNRLQKSELIPAVDDLRADMYEHSIAALTEAGYQHYELSSFTRPGHVCRHNQAYWSGESYLAFGPGASAYVNGTRLTNHRSPNRYMQLLESGESPVAETERLEGLDAARERLAIGLRNVRGYSIARLETGFGIDLDRVLGKAKSDLLEHRLIEIIDVEGDQLIRLTSRGIMVSDGVAASILNG